MRVDIAPSTISSGTGGGRKVAVEALVEGGRGRAALVSRQLSFAQPDFLVLASSCSARPPRLHLHRLSLTRHATSRPHLDLPTELLVRALSRCDGLADIARSAAVSLVFRASLAEQGILLWAR